GLGPSFLPEFHIMVETEGLAQLDLAFAEVSSRAGAVEGFHHAVNSRVRDVFFALYRDFPDVTRRFGEEKFCRCSFPRHCKEWSDEAIHERCAWRDGLLRCARNDGFLRRRLLLRHDAQIVDPEFLLVALVREGFDLDDRILLEEVGV